MKRSQRLDFIFDDLSRALDGLITREARGDPRVPAVDATTARQAVEQIRTTVSHWKTPPKAKREAAA